jgi:hypothetical protein
MYRGVNICYDIRRFNNIKAERSRTVGVWQPGLRNSDYQTYLREAVMKIEDKVMNCLKKRYTVL